MANLTFPVVPSGLAVPVWVGLNGNQAATLHAAGLPIPPPVAARGEVDTGSNVTAVASWVLQRLALVRKGQTAIQTTAGLIRVNLYDVSLSITDPSRPGAPMLTRPTLLVSELTTVLPDADVLVGLDVLLEIKTFVDGPGRQFTLEF